VDLQRTDDRAKTAIALQKLFKYLLNNMSLLLNLQDFNTKTTLFIGILIKARIKIFDKYFNS